ncbi:MAG: hypothetical protein IJA23_02640 [Clostridia bacterium]|nr:hypothetical protein [Clostridia bacterium]
MSQTLTPAQKRARTRKRNELENEIARIEYLLTNYKWDKQERIIVEKNLNHLRRLKEEVASDEEIKGANL